MNFSIGWSTWLCPACATFAESRRKPSTAEAIIRWEFANTRFFPNLTWTRWSGSRGLLSPSSPPRLATLKDTCCCARWGCPFVARAASATPGRRRKPGSYWDGEDVFDRQGVADAQIQGAPAQPMHPLRAAAGLLSTLQDLSDLPAQPGAQGRFAGRDQGELVG